MKKIIKNCSPIIDQIFFIIIVFPALILKFYRRFGSSRLPKTTRMLKKIGVMVIRDHYYEPQFIHENVNFQDERELPGIELNLAKQLEFLNSLRYSDEFISKYSDDLLYDFRFGNGNFEAGDAEILYNMVRDIQPKRVVEIGCGSSTQIIRAALDVNDGTLPYKCDQICIEPYENPWLDKFPGIKIIRQRVQDVETSIFSNLEENDLLFIDSSHMIRPGGDVLYEYLDILPRLQRGCYVHIHDIFTPRDYLPNWLNDNVLFWNEQYLMEALLSNSGRYEVKLALNYIKHHSFSDLSNKCMSLHQNREPGSMWLRIK